MKLSKLDGKFYIYFCVFLTAFAKGQFLEGRLGIRCLQLILDFSNKFLSY